MLVYYLNTYTYLSEININEGFLDFATGDYFSFKQEHQTWALMANVGLYYSKAAKVEGIGDPHVVKSN